MIGLGNCRIVEASCKRMVLPDSILELISRGESEVLEFKRSIADRSSAAKSISGMLNGERGGTVIFGVRDNGTIEGLEIGHETHDRLRNGISRIDPPVALDFETVPLSDTDRSLIVIRVPGNTGLYKYDGRAYLRLGASTSLMPERSYLEALFERMHATTRWENQTSAEAMLENLDEFEIQTTITSAIQNGRMADPGTRDVASLLNGLNLLKNGKPLNAAFILFGSAKVLEQYFPQCRLRMARFKGTDKSEFIDNRQIVGNIGTLLLQAQAFFATHIGIASRIHPERFERVDSPGYPLEALREALANAVCHRDYAEAGGGIDLAIYDDRLEITSTGSLRFGLTVQDLLHEHQSKLWNPLIANVLYKCGIVESWGRGTLNIVSLTERAGFPAPEFTDSRLSFSVRFFAGNYFAPTRVSQDLSEFQRQILSAMHRVGPASSVVIASGIGPGADNRQVLEALRTLRTVGLVRLRGEKRWAKWEIMP